MVDVMKIFIDSANLELISRFLDMNVVDGVTTNPSLLAKEGANPLEQAGKLIKLVKGPVNIEVIATDYEGIVEEGRSIAALGENAVVKIPMTKDGIRAVSRLSREGIRTAVTLVFNTPQALLAAKAGATYVIPFVGRLDDIGINGMELIRDVVAMYRNYSIQTKIIVASARHQMHVIESARLGADIITIPPDVLDKMFAHPLTDAGIKKFLEDWKTLEKQYGSGSPWSGGGGKQ